jgi:microcin C transport system substrate-binding protein
MARKSGLASAAAALFVLLALTDWPSFAADAGGRQHAVSLVGTPQYGPDYTHFDWVNANAPKGGRVRQWALGSFDSLNPFPVKGSVAAGVSLIYDQLMSSSPDEETTAYGLIAEWTTHAAIILRQRSSSDRARVSTMASRSRRGRDLFPRCHQESLPNYAFYYKNVTKAEKTGEHQVTFSFDIKGNRELPVIVGELPVLPQHFWQGTAANGEPRDLGKSTLEIPLARPLPHQGSRRRPFDHL